MAKLKYTKIKNNEQYNHYCSIHEKLFLDEENNIDEIELIELLLEEYDARIIKDKFKIYNPVQLLNSLVEDSFTNKSEFAKKINISTQILSDILSYRRNISKEMSLKFSKFFSMSLEAFSRPYPRESLRTEYLNNKNRKDDLKVIEGIGPKIEKILYEAKIYTFDHLAKVEKKYIIHLLENKGKSHYIINLSKWQKQAKKYSQIVPRTKKYSSEINS